MILRSYTSLGWYCHNAILSTMTIFFLLRGHSPWQSAECVSPSSLPTTIHSNICSNLTLNPSTSSFVAWDRSKELFRKQNCCVVSIPGLDPHMKALEQLFVTHGPGNIDLRSRVRIPPNAIRNKWRNGKLSKEDDEYFHTCLQNLYQDCFAIRQSVVPLSAELIGTTTPTTHPTTSHKPYESNDACTMALMELALGISSLAEGSLVNTCHHVYIRIVCASEYNAIDPPFHTDKAPLRGYVTLKGQGTEYVTKTCSPLEYVLLRMFGLGGLWGGLLISDKDVQRAKELEFIVMKGDHYEYEDPYISPWTWLMNRVWLRNKACIHRSPPGTLNTSSASVRGGKRRVIVSLDLEDGLDNREWYDVNKSREWRLGMTQRKSRLVA